MIFRRRRSLGSQLHDAIDRAKLDALWRIVIINTLNASVGIDDVGVFADAHGLSRAFGAAGITIDAVFGY